MSAVDDARRQLEEVIDAPGAAKGKAWAIELLCRAVVAESRPQPSAPERPAEKCPAAGTLPRCSDCGGEIGLTEHKCQRPEYERNTIAYRLHRHATETFSGIEWPSWEKSPGVWMSLVRFITDSDDAYVLERHKQKGSGGAPRESDQTTAGSAGAPTREDGEKRSVSPVTSGDSDARPTTSAEPATLSHTCVNTCTTSDLSVPPPCKACQFLFDRGEHWAQRRESDPSATSERTHGEAKTEESTTRKEEVGCGPGGRNGEAPRSDEAEVARPSSGGVPDPPRRLFWCQSCGCWVGASNGENCNLCGRAVDAPAPVTGNDGTGGQQAASEGSDELSDEYLARKWATTYGDWYGLSAAGRAILARGVGVGRAFERSLNDAGRASLEKRNDALLALVVDEYEKTMRETFERSPDEAEIAELKEKLAAAEASLVLERNRADMWNESHDEARNLYHAEKERAEKAEARVASWEPVVGTALLVCRDLDRGMAAREHAGNLAFELLHGRLQPVVDELPAEHRTEVNP